MSKVICRYLGGLRCEASLASGGAAILTDAPADSKGRGEHLAPTDLVAAALGNCMLTMMGYAADEAGLTLTGAVAEVEKELCKPPQRIVRIRVTIRMPAGLSHEQRARLEKFARMCPVHHSLPADMDRPVRFVYPD